MDVHSHALSLRPITLRWSHNSPLTPISTQTKLIRIEADSCAILDAAIGTTLAPRLASIIELLGGHVTGDLPEFVRDHAGVVGTYVKIPIAEDIVEVNFFLVL